MLQERVNAALRDKPAATTRGIANLARTIERHGLLLQGVTQSRRTTVIDVTRRLRNWAAHGSFERPALTELDATQALTLLVASTSALFPLAPQPLVGSNVGSGLPWYRCWRDLPPNHLLQALEGAAADPLVLAELRKALPEICSHVLTYGPAKSLRKLDLLIRRFGWPREALTSVLVERFPELVESLVWASPRQISDAITVVRSMGLRPHSQLLALLLPVDELALLQVVRSLSPHKAARYFMELATANASLFRELTKALARTPVFAQALWKDFDKTLAFLNNRAVLLSRCSAAVRYYAWSNAPPTVLALWAEKGPLKHVIQVLCLLLQGRGPHKYSAAELAEMALRRVNLAPSGELKNLPWLLSRFGASDSAFGNEVIRAIVAAVTSSRDSAAIRRALWDSYQCAYDERANILAAVSRAFVTPLEFGDQLALAGIEMIASHPSSHVVVNLNEVATLDEWAETVSSFEAALALIALTSICGAPLNTARLAKVAFAALTIPAKTSASKQVQQRLAPLASRNASGESQIATAPHNDR